MVTNALVGAIQEIVQICIDNRIALRKAEIDLAIQLAKLKTARIDLQEKIDAQAATNATAAQSVAALQVPEAERGVPAVPGLDNVNTRSVTGCITAAAKPNDQQAEDIRTILGEYNQNPVRICKDSNNTRQRITELCHTKEINGCAA